MRARPSGRQAHELGWHEMANWIKTVLALAGFAVVVLLLDGVAGVLADVLYRLVTPAPKVQIGTDTSTRCTPSSTSRSATTSLVCGWPMTALLEASRPATGK